MKTKTVYVANDGCEFSTEKSAIKHEALLLKIKKAIAPLGNIPKKVEDGKGWVQHSEANYRLAHRALVKLARPLFKSFGELYELSKTNPDVINPMGVAGRILSDYGSCIQVGWQRLCCIDKQFREHQQPYFAINKPDDNHVCIEDRR